MITRRCLAAIVLLAVTPTVRASEPDLYTSRVIVTGTGEENRLPGLRACVAGMLVRVSGDQRILDNAALAAIEEEAPQHVAGYRYRDRLEGVPIHDEQGTYDRPHDLTCLFDQDHADDLLAQLGSRPWPLPRPGVAVFLHVSQGGGSFVLTQDGSGHDYMRESLLAAAEPLALDVRLPSATSLPPFGPDLPGADEMTRLPTGDGEVALAIVLDWSDANLGWTARFRTVNEKGIQDWSAAGISFDEAFRIGMRGIAQIASGNGTP